MRKLNFILIFSFFSLIYCEIPEDYCKDIQVGFLPHPDPNNCVEFILCVLERPEVFRCERENEIFYPPVNNCVPGDPVTCLRDGATTLPIETETPPIDTTTTTISIETPTIPVETPTPPIETTTTTLPIETETPPIETTTLPVESPTPPIEETTTTTISIETPTIPVETPTPPIETTTTTVEIQTTPIVTTTTFPGQTTEQPPLGPPELCVGHNFRYVPNPDYCYRFYYCMFGLALPGECDYDRIFSERWRGCVLGDRETCTPNFPLIINRNRIN
ncbi:hypothetical protein PVAND_014854 [Polypedilum vanderplanki]|uniref:Chitin-binding type-2 domain-containing protein n=1 Tax=Polypedilum vanderplanki TaxID=319348 RepID=A0A9J6BAK3_POLVA|nr:hypothetical protein PVAND_014854 [Polypedilum vanderplanki]